MTIHIQKLGGNAVSLMWESGERYIQVELSNGSRLRLAEAALENFADAADDALGRRPRKKAKP